MRHFGLWASIILQALAAPRAWSESLLGLRIPVTSLERVDEVAGRPLELKEGDDRILEVGARQKIRVRFKFSDLSRQVLSKELPRGENRLGLFLLRERQTIASVQRGTLEACDSGFCSALFEGNALFQFYADRFSKPQEWFVQILQNPVLEERLLEIEKNGAAWFRADWIQVSLSYGLKAVTLSEKSSTPFNDSKVSRKASFGSEWTLFSNIDRWEIYARFFGATLDTKGFFLDDFISKVSERQYSLSYGYPLHDWVLLGATLGKHSAVFSTTNDDASILNTEYRAFHYGPYLRYLVPYDLWSLKSGDFVLDSGEGMLGYYRSFKGSSKDTGDWKRGESSYWQFSRIRFQHAFKTRASRVWLDKIILGLEGEYDLLSEKFRGAPSGPSIGLPAGSESKGSQFFWKIYMGREFVLR